LSLCIEKKSLWEISMLDANLTPVSVYRKYTQRKRRRQTGTEIRVDGIKPLSKLMVKPESKYYVLPF
jgi:hypothetical protein